MSEFNFWFLCWGMWYMYTPKNKIDWAIQVVILAICGYKMASTW